MEDFVFYSQHRPHEHQHIHHLLLNPAFTPHTKHFLKVRTSSHKIIQMHQPRLKLNYRRKRKFGSQLQCIILLYDDPLEGRQN